jgi:cellulose synthase/poly-beta-1,6-N-acetylglucosamine synthase-like glycosyltransferase
MTAFFYTALIIYTLALVYITIYCLMQVHLLFWYKKAQKENSLISDATLSNESFPFVTVQLPIYNEMYVAERLIDTIIQLDYPKEKLEIQVLDDSTDETVDLVAAKVKLYQAAGFEIYQVRRKDRKGFKAGALKEGMKQAKGEFIAIFDADFLPRKEFLKATIPYFANPEVGVVQTRWEHLNENYSLITRLQALQLNVHFTVEQKGREAGNYLLQFNGTAGVWRKQTIAEAGGWEADTLTEDLDLSIRAQLRGYKIIYLEKFGSPAELPAEMNGLKSQQFRWMKGGAETARKMLPAVWRSGLSFGKKLHTTLHLLASSIFLFVFLVGLFSVPLIFGFHALGINADIFTFFLIGWMGIIAVYYVGNIEADLDKNGPYLKRLLKFTLLFPLFLALSMGLSLHNSIAVIQGYLGKKSPFVRTPKFNILGMSDTFSKKKYFIGKLGWTTLLEGVMAVYFLAGIFAGIQLENYNFLLFHFLLSFGYGTIFYYTLRHLSLK